MRRAFASGAIVLLAIVGCTASGDDGLGEPDDVDASVDNGDASVLPPPSGYDGSASDASDGGVKKDASSDAKADADAGAAPNPGDPCTKDQAVATRSCGKCGKQSTLCQPADGGLAWTEYGPCEDELGVCVPGSTQACGNCGKQSCTSYCTWSACTGEPPQSCPAGTLQFSTVGCPTGGFRSRTCSAACTWGPYSLTCDTPNASTLWAGGAGANSTFMKGTDGKTYAWGLDTKSQLGDGDTVNKSKIIPTPFANVVSVAVGGASTYGFACAAFADGSAKCWGYNSTSYTLGDGVTSTSTTGVTPTGFGAGVIGMAAGYAHGCGVFADGTARCWGYNGYGQLGNGTTTTSSTPVSIGLTGVSEISSGYYTVCARAGDAGYCWGYNYDGEVGDGSTSTKSSPTLVLASGVASLAPGYYHTCAAMTDGTAKCWGENVNGEIGDGTGASGAPDVTTPRTVVGIDGIGASLTGVEEVCTGWGLSCARLTDGRVACWGRNADGQLGIGDLTKTMSNVPKVVSGITAATRLVCGYKHACAVDGGRPKCWGDNLYGQIGNGGMPNDASSAQAATF